MDDRDRIREAIDGGAASREDLAEALGVSVPSVGRLYRKERQLKARERDLAFGLLGLQPVAAQVRQVPLIGQIAAGTWETAIEEPLGWAYTTRAGDRVFALRVDGDSMDRLAPPGSSVIIDPDDRDLIDGRSYALMNEHGESTLKRFRVDPARFEPVSTNPSHSVLAIGRDGFTLVGRAVEVSQEL